MIALRATHTAYQITNEIRFPELPHEPPPSPPSPVVDPENAKLPYVPSMPYVKFWHCDMNLLLVFTVLMLAAVCIWLVRFLTKNAL